MASTQNTVLPMYLAIDGSKSMNKGDSTGQGGTSFTASIGIAQTLYETMHLNASVAERLRTEVILFGDEPRVVHPLSDPRTLEDWTESAGNVATDGHTRYSKAFTLIKKRIDVGVESLKKEGADHFEVFRPLVIFLTDGVPTEGPEHIQGPFSELTDENYGYRPNIICIGVGDATEESLGKYAAGTVHAGSERRDYVIGNPDMLILPKLQGEAPADTITRITGALVRSVVGSVNSSTEVKLSKAGIAEPVIIVDKDFEKMADNSWDKGERD